MITEKEINEMIEEEVRRWENIGCEVTNIEIKEDGIKIQVNNYNNDCYGGYEEAYKVRFPKEERKSPKPKPQSDELCPHCGNKIEKKHKFCPQCGHKIEKKEKENGIKFCPQCGQKIGENNIFCPQCGQKITSGDE